MGAMTRRPRRALLALPLVAAALLLPACGGSGLAENPQQVLDEAVLPPPGPNASRLVAELNPTAGAAEPDAAPDAEGADGGDLGALLGGPIAIEATTEGDVAQGVIGDARITAGPAVLALAFRANGDDAWLQVGDAWYALGGPLPLDPAAAGGAIDGLVDAIEDPRATAVEDVEGVECDRITGTLPADALGADALGALTGGLPLPLDSLTAGEATMSVWVAREDGVVRRVKVEATGTAGVDAAAAGGDVMIDLTVVPGEVQEVAAPADAKPIEDLLLDLLGDAAGDGLGQLGDLFGGLLGGGDPA